MKAGESFGELALLSNDKIRTATVATVEQCIFATITQECYDQYLTHVKDKKEEFLIKWLRSTAFFGKWSRSMLLKLQTTMKELTVHRGTIMCFENEKCSRFFIISEGEFELTKKVHKPISKDDPEEVFLQTELKRLKRVNRTMQSSESVFNTAPDEKTVFDGNLESDNKQQIM